MKMKMKTRKEGGKISFKFFFFLNEEERKKEEGNEMGGKTHLKRKIKRMLHLLCPEDNLSSVNQEEAAVTQIGDVQGRVVEESEEAC